MDDNESTFDPRLLENARSAIQSLEASEQTTKWWLEAGLVGFVVLVSGDLGSSVMQGAPSILTSLLLTFTLGAGITLVLARASLRFSKRKVNKATTTALKAHSLYKIQEKREEESDEEQDRVSEAEHARVMEVYAEAQRELDRAVTWSKRGKAFHRATYLLAPLAVMVFLTSAWWAGILGALAAL